MALKGQRVRELREDKGYTREKLAEMVGASPTQIWRWEEGVNDPTADFIERLARILRTSSDYLIGLEDHPADRQRERDLSSDEVRLVEAYRAGRLWDIVALLDKVRPEAAEPPAPQEGKRDVIPGD